jgi:hypothetical protein
MFGGFGFQRSQAERDAWEVKDFTDHIATTTGNHNSTETGEEYDPEYAKTAGGFKQNYRAFILAFAAYMG